MRSNRHHHTAIRAVSLCLMVIMLLALAGCPNPNRHIWFGEEGRKKKLSVRLADNRVQLKITSSSRVGSCTDYELYLRMDLKTSRSDCQLSIDPAQVQARLDGLPMTIISGLPDNVIDTVSDRHYRVMKNFRIVSDIHRIDQLGSLPVDIVLDGFLTLDGEPIHIDTIRAVERRRCL